MKLSLRGVLAAVCLLLVAPAVALAQPAGAGAGTGSPNDAAWSGSGAGSSIAIQKAIRNLLAGTLTVGLPTGASTSANQTSANIKLDQLHADLTSATPAGTAIIGKVGVDQTTPGTTNGVAIAPSSASAIGIAPIASSAAEACHVFKASAGNLYGVSGYIGAAGYIMVFNSTSAPSDGAVTPVAWAYVPTAGSWSINYGILPAVMSTGITVCASSTGPLSKTAFSTNTVFSGRVQ